MTPAHLPPAALIGPTFTPYAQPDAPEDGVVSNGTPVLARDPRNVAESIVPLGCPGADELGPLPVPRYALEQAYRTPHQLAAVAVVLEYRTDAEATALLAELTRMLGRCTAPAATAKLYTPRLVAVPTRPDAVTLYDTRHEVGPDAATTVWDETVVRAGRRVALVIVERLPHAAGHDRRALVADTRTRLAG